MRPQAPDFLSSSPFLTPGLIRPVTPPSPSERFLINRARRPPAGLTIVAARPSLDSSTTVTSGSGNGGIHGGGVDGGGIHEESDDDGFEIIGSNPCRRSPPPPPRQLPLPHPRRHPVHPPVPQPQRRPPTRPQPTMIQRPHQRPRPLHQPPPSAPPPPMQMPRMFPTATQGFAYVPLNSSRRDVGYNYNTTGLRMLTYGTPNFPAPVPGVQSRPPVDGSTRPIQSQSQPAHASHSQADVQHMLGLPKETCIFRPNARSRPSQNDLADGYI